MIYPEKIPNKQPSLYRGSISVFLALTLTLILSFLFSILELGRVQGLEQLSKRNLNIRLESEFAKYNCQLWEDYGMLFMDAGFGKEELDIDLIAEHILEESYLKKEGIDFYSVALRDIEINQYALATDYNGAAFRSQAGTVIQEQLKSDAVDTVKELITQGNEMTQKNTDLDQQWEDAQNAVKEAEDKKQKMEEEQSLGSREEGGELKEEIQNENLPENPMEYVKLLKKSTLLPLVMEHPSELSGKAVDNGNHLESRNRNCGNKEIPQQIFADKIWFLQYLNYYFSCETGMGKKGSSNHALDYELEYCFGGKATDQANLEKTVKGILAIREVGNFAVLMQDSAKKEIALGIAVAAVGFTGMPPLIKAVQIGILLGWSYIESIQDVRCLLSGGKVALVKEVSEWKSDISNIRDTTEGSQKAAEDKNGLDYRNYLQILLFATGEKILTDRAMDIVEKNLQMYPECGQVRMDNLVHDIQVQAVYTAEPLFLNLFTITKPGFETYHFNAESQISYLH